MFINTDTLTPIERADLAQRLARRQMGDAVDALVKAQGVSVEAAARYGVHFTNPPRF